MVLLSMKLESIPKSGIAVVCTNCNLMGRARLSFYQFPYSGKDTENLQNGPMQQRDFIQLEVIGFLNNKCVLCSERMTILGKSSLRR